MSKLFGHYELGEHLGDGGMGEVCKAFDRHLRREVALKRLRPHLSADPLFVARFRRECEIATRLDHEHIVKVFDFGVVLNQLYVSMQLVGGQTLAKRIATGPLTNEVALGIFLQVASALDYAHDLGVEHRDVKPSNIMLSDRALSGTHTPFTYLVDFGIARAPDQTAITSNDVIGSVAYMPPERLNGASSDSRSDVYSLACVLFEMLTRTEPFPRHDNVAVIYAHVYVAPPTVTAVRRDLPSAIDDVIERGMAKDPLERYASAGELATAFRTALVAPGETTTSGFAGPRLPRPDLHPAAATAATVVTTHRIDPKGRQRTRFSWFRMGLAGLAVVAVAAGVLVSFNQGTSSNQPESRSGSAGRGANPTGVTSRPGSESTGSSSRSSLGASDTGPAAGAIGSCLDGGMHPVACDSPHALEVYSRTPCTVSGLLTYLGGQTGTDTLLDVVQGEPVRDGDATVCAVVGPRRDQTTGTSRDVLLTSAGDAWRRCTDAATGRTVGCDQAHTSEYVLSATVASPSTVDCDTAASTYFDAPVADFAGQLRVQKAARGTLVVCVVSVRGGDVLTASLRRIGTRTLPLQPK